MSLHQLNSSSADHLCVWFSSELTFRLSAEPYLSWALLTDLSIISRLYKPDVMRLVALSVRLILAFLLATSNKTWLYGPSKLTTLQLCHNPLRKVTHNTINIRHFQVSVIFLTTPNDVYRPSPCWCQIVLQGRCVVFNKPWKLSAICYNFISTVHLSCYRYVYYWP